MDGRPLDRCVYRSASRTARVGLLGTYDQNIFDTGARTAIAGDPEASIPCFRIIHEDTKIIKK